MIFLWFELMSFTQFVPRPVYFLRSLGLAEGPRTARLEEGQETMLSSRCSPPRQATK